MLKRIFSILILATFLVFLCQSFCLAQARELEIQYPEIPGVETPTKTKTALPEYLKYVFSLTISLAGLLAFGALISGGFRYLTSAGDPTKMGDAKEQVLAGILGLIILLSSYLILNTINPRLVLPKSPQIEGKSIRLYSLANCQEDDDHPSLKVIGDISQLYKETDAGVILDWGTDGTYQIASVEFLTDPGEVSMRIFPENDFQGDPSPPYDDEKYKEGYTYSEGENSCLNLEDIGDQRSLRLKWHIPGVYLYAKDNCKGEFKIYQSSTATLPDFDDQAQSIKLVYGRCDMSDPENSDKCKDRYAAIVHEKEGYVGEAILYDQEPGEDDDGCRSLSINPLDPDKSLDLPRGIDVSSLTVYLKPEIKSDGEPNVIGKGVLFYEDKNYGMHEDCSVENIGGYFDEERSGGEIFSIEDAPVPHVCGEGCDGSCEDKVSSMEIDGHYIVLLFRDKDFNGDCEVFPSPERPDTRRFPDFRNYRIGQCGWLGRSDCLSSFIIRATK